MNPLHFGKRDPNMKTKSFAPPSLLIAPVAHRLILKPVFDRFFITSPDKGAEERGKVGGVHLPENSTLHLQAYAEVEVLGVGPDVKTVKEGNRVLVTRPQCQRVNHQGQDYWWTTETAVMGIIA